MSRLTTKDGKYEEYNVQNGVCYGIKRYENDLTHKLSKLEDLEEKYNIDVNEVLFKKVKAFDIIKEKNVDIIYLMELFDCIKKGEDTNESALKQYNDSVRNGINKCELTKEEFELLKEVLK